MFCSECGTQLPDDSTFCHNCGTKADVARQPVQRPQAVESPAQAGATMATARPAARPVPNSRPATRPPVVAGPAQPAAKYVGASMVIATLWILGWLTAFLGIVGGFYNAAEVNCPEFMGDTCSGSDETGAKVVIFIVTVLASWLMAVFILWGAYVLRLLSDMEIRLRSGTPATPPTDVRPEEPPGEFP
jgi:hypothetical protein